MALDGLFSPSSVAVVGASRDPKKSGHAVISNLKSSGFGGAVYPVNPDGADILGYPTFPNVSAVGRPVDMAVIVVPSQHVFESLRDCARAGVRAVAVITSGFRDAGMQGLNLEGFCRDVVRDTDIRILGPHCLGVINTWHCMNASLAFRQPPRGRTAFFCQSQALGLATLDWATANDFGISCFVSFGTMVDVNEADVIEHLMNDPNTDVILGHVEDVEDGRRFLEVSRRATKQKPVVILKSGGTKAGERAASSHSGTLAGQNAAFRAAFKQTGILRAEGLRDLFEAAVALGGRKHTAGARLLILTNAGGPGIIAADVSERVGLQLPILSRPTLESLEDKLPPTASLYNPIDILGDARADRYGLTLEKAVSDPNIDGVVIILTPQALTEPDKTAEAVVRISKTTNMPIVASFMGGKLVEGAARILKIAGIPNFACADDAVKAFMRLSDFGRWKAAPFEEVLPIVRDIRAAKESIISRMTANRYTLGVVESMPILAAYGFTFPKHAMARSPRQAAMLATEIGFPVVLKIVSPDVVHKTDIGGMKVGLNSAEQVEEAFVEITTNAYRLVPYAFIEGIIVAEMVRDGREVILGVSYDTTFGHMVRFGLGGLYAELLREVSFRITPLTVSDAYAMIQEVKTAAILMGARGERPVDVDALVDAILRLSALVTDFPVIHELEINPLQVMEEGTVALDACMVLRCPEC